MYCVLKIYTMIEYNIGYVYIFFLGNFEISTFRFLKLQSRKIQNRLTVAQDPF
jgi:hypothetical protein